MLCRRSWPTLWASAIEGVAGDDAVRALVIAGQGRCFCAGADIDALGSLGSRCSVQRVRGPSHRGIRPSRRLPEPSVAAVHGVPKIKLGLLPGAGGTAHLPRLLPRPVAAELLMTGQPLDAAAAHRLGLVNLLAPPGGALAVAVELAADLASLPPLALAAAKRLLSDGVTVDLATAVDLERSTVATLDSEDRVEGIAAFGEKRPPLFRGC